MINNHQALREATRRRADTRDVRGWVRNNEDGTVEAHFEGDPEAVDAMVRFVHEGPGAAQVKHVDVEDAQPEGLDGFEAR